MELPKPSDSDLVKEVSSLKKQLEELRLQTRELMSENEKNEIELKRYKSLIEYTTDGLAIYEYGKLIYISGGYIKMLGFGKDELINISLEEIYSFIHPDDRDRIISIINESHKNQINNFQYEFRVKTKDGGYIFVEDIIYAEYDEKGNHIRSIIHTHNISEKKYYELDLKKYSDNLKAIIEAIPDMVFRMNKDFVYLDYKGPKEKLYYRDNSIIGKKNSDVLSPDFAKLVEEKVTKTLSSGEISIFEYSLELNQNEIKDFEARIVPLGTEEVVSIVRDITEKKQTETKLAESEENARAIMESTSNIIILLDKEGIVLDSNESHAKRFGLTRNDIIGKSVYDYLPKDIARERKEAHDNVIRSGKAYHGEDFRGGYWNKFSIFPVRSSNGNVEKVAVFSEDITENKRLLNELTETSEKMKLATEVARIGIWDLDMETKELFWDQGMYNIFGLNPEREKISYAKAYQMLHPEDREKLASAILNNPKEKKEVSLEVRIILSDNSIRYIKTTAGITRDTNGKIKRLIGVDFDITEKKLADLKILESEAILRAMMENSLESIWSVDLDYRLQYINKSFYDYFFNNFGIELKKGMRIIDLIPPEDIKGKSNWIAFYKRAFNNEHYVFVDNVDIEQGVLHHEVSMNPIIINDKVVGASCYSKDISERIVAEQALKKSENELRELNETKDKFFGIIAHDLRSPFQVFLNITDLLKNKLESLTIKELSDIMTELNSKANNLYNLLRNLLEWANMQRQITKFEPKVLPLKDSVKKTIELISPLSEKKKIGIIDLTVDCDVFADEYMLNSILQNLLLNSIKFTEKGGSIYIHGIPLNKGKVQICVEDTGIGIPENILEKLFRLDCNYKRTGTDGEDSSGLGLLLCKEFIEKHKGKIWVESKEGKGSKFYFVL